MSVKALIVQPDGSKEYRDIEGDLDTLRSIVGGHIEFVFVTNGVHAYVNEEGKLLDLRSNPEATRLAGLIPWDFICGTAVFLGDGPEGEEGDLPPEWQNLV